MSDYKRKRHKTPRELREEKESHILELIKTHEVREIVDIYPDMNSQKITKIVTKEMYR